MSKRFDPEHFQQFLIENSVVGFFEKPIVLKSGRESCWYANWRHVAADAFLFDQLIDFVIAFAHDHDLDPDCFYGVPEGATKLGVLTTYKWAKAQPLFKKGSHPLPMGRAKVKEHGSPEDRYYVGEPRGRVVVLEDVTTTGGSLLESIARLREIDVEIMAALGLTHRMQKRDDGKSVEEALHEEGIRYVSLSRAVDFLPEIVKRTHPREEIVKQLQHEFEEYGAAPLIL